MFYNYQNDPLWKDDTMATESDTIGQLGCLVTCIANILEITPGELNSFLKNNKKKSETMCAQSCQIV